MDAAAILVYITVPAEAEAHALARLLVERRLAAGVNVVGGARSIYRWQGEVRQAQEWLLLAQASAAALDELLACVTAAHSHEVPCIVAMPISAGHEPFLDWIARNSAPDHLPRA